MKTLRDLISLPEAATQQGMVDDYTTEKQVLTRIRQIKYDRKLSGTESHSVELHRLKQRLKDIRSQQGVAEGSPQIVAEAANYLGKEGRREWRRVAKSRGYKVVEKGRNELEAYNNEGEHVGSHLRDDGDPRSIYRGYFDDPNFA